MRLRRARRARRAAALAAAASLLGSLACGPEAAPDGPRLLLLLTCDTLRADRLGAYGNELGLTPSLDSLLAESVVFEHAYAPASYTLPSVAALMTGRHPEELGMLGNVSRLETGFATLAMRLSAEGVRTGAVVGNYVLRGGTGIERGFEVYDDEMLQNEANREMPERIATDTTEAALVVLDRLRPGAERIFLWVHYQDPHGPYTPPPGTRSEYLEAERRAPDGDRLLPSGRGSLGLGALPEYQIVDGRNDVAFYRAGYDAEVAYFDAQAGRLLDGIGERGLLAGATIVFTADHGEGMGEDDYWFAHGEYLSDALVRVPLAFRVPGERPARRRDPAALVDVFPTLLARAGVAVPGGYPGRDLLAPGAAEAEPEIYLATLRGATLPRYGLVAGGRKYVLTEDPRAPHEVLHPVGEDARDVAAEEPDVLADLRQRLARLREGLATPGAERTQVLAPEDRERLRRLGYVVD